MLVMTFSAIPINCSAVEVNYHEVVVGDIITYELHAGNCPKDIYALDVSIYYDNAALEIVEDSFYLPNLTGYIANTDLEGEIRFNAVTLDGFQFQPDKILATVKFRVISDYNPYPFLKYEVKNFIDIDYIDYLETYTYDLTYVNEDFSSVEDNNSQITSDLSDTEIESEVDIYSNADNSFVDTETNTATETNKGVSTDSISHSDNSDITEIAEDNSTEMKNKATPDSVATEDSVSANANSTNIYAVIAVAIGAVIIIAVLFIIIKKSSHTGSHIKK